MASAASAAADAAVAVSPPPAKRLSPSAKKPFYTEAPMAFIESPYSRVDGSAEPKERAIARNMNYLEWARLDASTLGYVPLDSHGSMTRHPMATTTHVCDYDTKWNLLTRDGAIDVAHNIRMACKITLFYIDRGWSRGMLQAKALCDKHGLPYEVRRVNVQRIMQTYPNMKQFGTAAFEFLATLSNTSDYRRFQSGQYTVAIVKPDAFHRSSAISGRMENYPLGIKRSYTYQTTLTKGQAEALYAEHKGKPFFPALIEHMTSGPSLVVLLTMPPGTTVNIEGWWRRRMEQLRAHYADPHKSCANAVHGSDSVQAAEREAKLLFGDDLGTRMLQQHVRTVCKTDPNAAAQFASE